MPPLDFSDMQGTPQGVTFDDLHPESTPPQPAGAGISFDDLQPGQRTFNGLPMAPGDEGVARMDAPAPASSTGSSTGSSGGIPNTPQPNGAPYQSAVAVRPGRGVEQDYTPTGGVIRPNQGVFGAMANSLASGAVTGTTDAMAGAVRGSGYLASQSVDPDEAAGRAMSGQPVMPDGHALSALSDAAADRISGAGQSAADQAFPVGAQYAKSSWVKGASMIGGGLPYLAAAAVSGPAGWFSAAAAGGSQIYESTYKEAVEHGASPDQAHQDALLPSLIGGGLMSVNAGVLLKGLPWATQSALLQPIVDYAASAGTMVGVSELQKIVGNVNAQNTYDPSRSAFQGVSDDIGLEALTGAGLHGAAHGAAALRGAVGDILRPDMDPALRSGALGITDAATAANAREPAPEATEPAQTANDQASEPSDLAGKPASSGTIDFSDMQPGETPAEPAQPAPAADPRAPITGDTFEQRAGGVVSRLMADLGLTREQAAGAAGGLGGESGLEAVNEKNPTVPGSRGGFGWGQWTGTRRTDFEQFAKDRGLSVTDPEANYQFLVHELTGKESAALAALRQAGSVDDATKVFTMAYERPGIMNMGSRLDFARKAAGASDQVGATTWDAAQDGSGPVNRVYAGDIGIDTMPQLAELSDLVASHDADGRVNSDYPHEDGLQPRDRSTVGSQAQVREIASKLNPALLAPSPDASGGAPIVGPDGRVVENGNGRVAALSLAYTDPSLSSQADAYRKFLGDQGYDTAGMKQPVLVSRRITPLDASTLQQFIKNTADRATLGMTPAERGQADAKIAGSAIDLWQGSTAGSAANAPFVRAFMAGIPPAERGGMIGPDGSLSSAGEKRVQGAVVAHAYGDQLGPTLDRFLNDDAEGLKAISGGMSDAAGVWAQMRSEAQRGMIPASLDITADLAQAVQLVDRARQNGRPVAEALAQGDLTRPVTPMVADLVRSFFRDPEMKRPAGRDVVADRLRAYADTALKTQPGPDMFGTPPAGAPEVLKAASLRADGGSRPMLAARDARVAHSATMADPDARSLTPEAVDARDRVRTAAQAMMRFMGLPETVGLRLVDKIVAGEHGADGSYTRGLIELALDTRPSDLPKALMHESVHALMDPELDLLNKGQRDVLLAAADRWLAKGENRASIERLYGTDKALVREEALARLGEEAFARGMKGSGPVGMVYGRMLNAVRGIGQVLRGQGYRTADDVFRGVLRGERALPGSREALMASGPAGAILSNSVAPQAARPDGQDQSATSTAIREQGSVPDRYLSLRDKPPVMDVRSDHIAPPATAGRRKAVEQWAIKNLRGQTVRSEALGADVVVSRKGLTKAISHAGDDLLSAFPAIPSLIEKGGIVRDAIKERDDPNDTDTRAWHLLGGNVRIDGRDVPMVVHVRESANGRFFYDLGMNTEVGAAAGKSGSLGQSLHGARDGAAPEDNMPSPDPDRKFAKRDRDTGPMLWDKAGLERAGQAVLPGAERDERGALQRQMDASLSPKAIQKAASDLPLFSSERGQGKLFALRQNLTTAVRDASEEPRRAMSAMVNQALFPMRAGSKQAQVIAMKFANALRGIQFRYGQIDRQLVREFNPAQRAAMGRALDAQSVFEQRVRSGEATEADRAAFDAGKTGLAGLDPKQRQVVEDLNKLSQQTWKRMADRGIVMPNADGLPYYMPRQFVMMDSLAGARRITAADNQIEGGKGGSGGGGLTAMDKVGANLTTSGPKAREYLTPEESEKAARTKFGDNVHLVTDIRSLLDAVRRQEQSVAGRDLVDAIKRIGVESGTDLVHESGGPVPKGFFTLDHPSLQTVGPTGETDPSGKPIYGRMPLHIDEQFRGPLNAVLSRPNPDWYRALMAVKSKSMSAIMFSPAMHLMVEVGRSLPLYHGNPAALISSMARAGKLTRDRAFMDQAVSDGLAPIGQGFGALEASSIVNEAAGLPSKTLIGKLWNGDTKAQHAWHELHRKALWDNVFRLQTGIYNDMRTKFIGKGFDPKSAGIMAAHLANRYAGALPPEQLSKAANMAANVEMFSRSFTLGNLAVMKDMLNGAPSHVRAALEEAGGDAGADKAMGALRRKAIGTFIMDIGMFYAMNALAQTGFAAARNWSDGDDLPTIASKAWQDYADHIMPQWGNEPGKEDRVYVGKDTAGTGVYARTPMGKVGEEFTGWMPVIGHPGTMILSKMNPLLRATWEAVTGRDSLGRGIYNPSPQGIGDHLKIAGQAVMHIAASQVPADFLGQVYDLATGQSRGDTSVAAARLLGPLSGLASVSQGYPGGPEAGVKHAEQAHADYDHTIAKAEARRLYALGREDDARAALDKAYADAPREAASAWRNIVAPERAQVRFNQRFNRTASAEARERVAGVTGGSRP